MASVEARSWYKFDPLVTIFYGDDDVFDDFLPVSYRKSGFGVFFSKDLDEGGFKLIFDFLSRLAVKSITNFACLFGMLVVLIKKLQ